MNRATLRYGLRSAALTIMSSLISYCALADSTVTASREYVNRKFDAALGYVDAAMEDQWTATTNVISSSSASATNYIDSATNDVLVAAQGYADEKISSSSASATNYVDSATNDVLVAAQGYADEKISASSASATNYVDSATNDVLVAAQGYADEKISEIPPPDFSTNNVELVETIETMAPPPGDYAAVSNAAVYAAITNALQDAALTNKLDKSGGTVAGSDDDPMGIVLGRMYGYPSIIVTDGASSIGFSGATMSIVTQNGDFSLPLSSGNLARAADNPTEGNLAALDAFGNLTDSGLSKDDVESLFFAQYYPEGNVKSAAEFTPGIKYDDPNTTARTITVKTFGNVDDPDNDNSELEGRVVIPPFVDAQGNPYISDDGTRFKVVGVSGRDSDSANTNLTAIVTPNTVTNIGYQAFIYCDALDSVSLPAATTIGGSAFGACTSLASVSLPAATTIGGSAFYKRTSLTSVSLPSATTIGDNAFNGCTSLTSVSLPAATNIGINAFCYCPSLTSVSLPAATIIKNSAFYNCTSLTSVSLPAATTIGGNAFTYCTALSYVDFGDTPRPSVPSLGANAFNGVPTTCKIIVPDAQYDAWTAASGWSALVTAGYKFLRHSEWEYVRKYELTATEGRVAMFIIPLNEIRVKMSSVSACDVDAFPYVGFELKASTNNFSSELNEFKRLQFYADSDTADTGGSLASDKMQLFICSTYSTSQTPSYLSGDPRPYKPLLNTIEDSRPLYSLVVLVDTRCLVRHPESAPGEWLSETNDELTWVWIRKRRDSPAYENEAYAIGSIYSDPLWRPIAPVRWFRKVPEWARRLQR